MPETNQHADELEAFCSSCPAPEEVSTFLERLGMRLDFQMEACPPSTASGLAVLPAQFHFEEASGISIIYLAGEDSPLEAGERLPPHKSRFLAYAGADGHVFGQIIRRMALQWSLSWRGLPYPRPHTHARMWRKREGKGLYASGPPCWLQGEQSTGSFQQHVTSEAAK